MDAIHVLNEIDCDNDRYRIIICLRVTSIAVCLIETINVLLFSQPSHRRRKRKRFGLAEIRSIEPTDVVRELQSIRSYAEPVRGQLRILERSSAFPK